jgi:hypothetical protein
MHPDIVELAQGSETATDFEAGALRLLQRQVGCDVAFFVVKGEEANTTVLGLDQATSRHAVSNEAYAGELIPVKRAALSTRGVAVDTEVLGHAGVRKTGYYRDLVAPVGGRHTLLGCLPWDGRTAGAIMLGRAGGAFSARAVEHVESLLPQLGVARAAFGLPWTSTPLQTAAKPSLLERLGLGKPARVVASVRTPSATISVRDRRGYREMVAAGAGSELVWTRAALSEYVIVPKAKCLQLQSLAGVPRGSVDAVEYARASIGATLKAARQHAKAVLKACDLPENRSGTTRKRARRKRA